MALHCPGQRLCQDRLWAAAQAEAGRALSQAPDDEGLHAHWHPVKAGAIGNRPGRGRAALCPIRIKLSDSSRTSGACGQASTGVDAAVRLSENHKGHEG